MLQEYMQTCEHAFAEHRAQRLKIVVGERFEPVLSHFDHLQKTKSAAIEALQNDSSRHRCFQFDDFPFAPFYFSLFSSFDFLLFMVRKFVVVHIVRA
jgi:hypothetical protein